MCQENLLEHRVEKLGERLDKVLKTNNVHKELERVYELFVAELKDRLANREQAIAMYKEEIADLQAEVAKLRKESTRATIEECAFGEIDRVCW